jgi:uncharacterized membrane protein YeaQ/YmgE (transglycosylase-associated protein family)
MVLLLSILLGGVIGGVARIAAPHRMPRRLDVATILAGVGAALGALGFVISRVPWTLHAAQGTLIAATIGAVAILLAYAVLPPLAPALTRVLPGRYPPTPD